MVHGAGQVGKNGTPSLAGKFLHRRWYRRLTHLYKLKIIKSLYSLNPSERELSYNLRMSYSYDQCIERTDKVEQEITWLLYILGRNF